MRYTSNTLAECERPMIRLICEQCGRKGQFRKATLVSKYGPDIVMPDLLRKVADCTKFDPHRGGCRVKYDLTQAELNALQRR
jgi:hypothetical protein